MAEDDGNWTIVVRRRASKVNSSSVSVFRDSHIPRSRKTASLKESLLQGSLAEQCDEALLLPKLKRSVARVEQSAFFKKFLDQAQSPSVFSHIYRIASDSPAERVWNEGGKLSASTQHFTHDLPTQKSAYDSGDELDLEIRSSKVRVGEGENRKLECTSACVSAVRLQPGKSAIPASECAQPAFECASAYMSETIGNRCGGTSCSEMTCSCMVKLCGDKSGCEGEWKYRSFMVSLTTTSSESKPGLTFTAGIEEESCNQMLNRPCIQIIAYGLGSIADSEVSRCQLALILLMKQRLVWVGDVHVYDPVLSETECKVIQNLGCSTIGANEEGRRSICKPTMFYMPHCEDWLYDNVLQANWMPQKLSQLIILGNSFCSYQDRWSSLIGVRSNVPPTYVLKFQQVAEEIPLEATVSIELPAFNNMSWHFYKKPGKASSLKS